MQIYSIFFNTEIMKMNAEFLNVNSTTDEIRDEEIHQILNATGYDFYDYSEDIAILVDDQGLFKEGLPVFEIESLYGDTARLAGKLLFVRNVETEYSVNIGSILDEDVLELRNELKIKFIGITKGVS